MPKPGNKVSRREADNRFAIRVRMIEAVTGVANNIVRWGGMVGLAYYATQIVGSLAGQSTEANIVVKVLANLQANAAFAWLFGAGGVWYGWRQRRLRRDAIERLSTRTTDLEKQLDPKRSSSQLTPRGDTNPEDQQ